MMQEAIERLKQKLNWILVFPVVFLMLSSTGLEALDKEKVGGVYSLSRGNRPIRPEIWQSSYISGIVVRSNWKTIEPESGRYRWEYFDQAVIEARKAGKKVAFSVLPGVMTPDWVYSEGAKAIFFRNPHPLAKGKMTPIPIPWDKIFLNRWSRFIHQFGERYGPDPTVSMITMSGGAANSVEMHLPKSPEGVRKFVENGYTKEKLVRSWKRVIDAYSEAFANKALILPVAVPLRRDGSLQEIIAYSLERLNARVYLATGTLSERTQPNSPMMKLMEGYRGKANIGFQMLSPASPASLSPKSEKQDILHNEKDKKEKTPQWARPQPVRNLREAFDIGLHAGARFIQVYQEDVLNPLFQEDIQYLANRILEQGREVEALE